MKLPTKTGGLIARSMLWLAALGAVSLPALAQEDWTPRYVPPQASAPAQPTTPGGTAPGVPPTTLAPGSAPATPTPAPAPAAPAPSTTKRKLQTELDVAAKQAWTDTQLDLQPGDKVSVTSDGKLTYSTGQCGPDGLPRGWIDLIRALPVNAAGVGALIGKIGDNPTEVPFLLGAKKEVTAGHGGRLFLGINQPSQQVGDGSFHVKVQIAPGAQASNTPAPAVVSLAPTVFDTIPRRVIDNQGNQGDMVNFVILGSEEKMKAVFEAAGWVQVDRTTGEAILHATLATLNREAYVHMPMSELYLFGRAQDYGWARALPVEVVASRHHLRLWKAPNTVNGQTLWVGAATHDLGFEKDQRTGGITHHIDPNIDDEREFVIQSLQATGLVGGLDYTTPTNALKGEALTATGGSFHSDGRIRVIALR